MWVMFKRKPLTSAVIFGMAIVTSVTLSELTAEKAHAAAKEGTSGAATTAGTPTTQSTPVVPNNPNSGMTDEQIQAYFKQHGRIPGLKDMVWPNERFTRSGGRFGEVRISNGVSRPHMGIDLSGAGGGPMATGDSGTVSHTSSDINKSAGYYISVKRDNGGATPNLNHHFRYLHMRAAPTHRKGSKVANGDVLGYEGSSGANISDVHLHLDYAVPKSQARDVFLNNPSTGRYVINGVSSARGGSWQGLVFTDPTPYFGRDQKYTDSGKNSALYRKYLGETWRHQFNTLYGTNLPTLPGSKGPTQALPQTVLTQLQEAYRNGARLTPDEMAAIRQGTVGAAIAAEQAGYNIGGSWVSQRTLASFMTLDDGADFSTLPEETRKLKVTEQSPKEIINTIGNSRYGNLEWVKAMQELNSKGLMTEFLMMQSEENFIREHNKRLKQRVEAMTATLTSGKLVEYSKKIQAIQVSADSEIVPSMIELQLEASGDEYVDGIPANGFDPMYDSEMDNTFASNAGAGNPALRAMSAARIASQRALPKSIGYCARYVRTALQQAGYKFTSQASAYMYHTNGTLKSAGFTAIASGSTNGYTPQVGDIVVWHRTSSTPHGHIQIYDGIGSGWVSDFRHGFYPYKSQRTNFTIYRDLSAAPAATAQGGVSEPLAASSSSSSSAGGKTCKFHEKAGRAGIKHFAYPEAKSGELTTFKGVKVHRDMVSSLKKMMEDAANQGAPLVLGSGFRSYHYQSGLRGGKPNATAADWRYSAPSGYSEHSTGFAVDFNPIDNSFSKTKGYRWLRDNASKYGFKQTFNESYSAKSGVNVESWHWAWHGNQTAKNMLANSSCL